MIEKKIYSDNPGLEKHIHGRDDDPPVSEDALKKDLPAREEEPLKEQADPVAEVTSGPDPVQHELPEEPELRIAALLLESFGKEAFERIRSEGSFMVPFTDEQTSLEVWTGQCIRMLFKAEEISALALNFSRWLEQKESATALLKQEILTLKERLEIGAERIRAMENDYVIADSERQQLRKELLSSISAVYFIDRFLLQSTSPEAAKIAGLLKEEMERPGEDFPHFVTGFTDGWMTLLTAISSAADDESGMEAVHLALTGLLEKIAGRGITARRAILEIVAGLCSAKFKLFKFISPEESLQVDPRIHSATALGGSTIREGVSFAVIRKDTMQTVKYAEIRV
jgi:hypothetical protein